MAGPDPTSSNAQTATAFRAWMAEHHDELERFRADTVGDLHDAAAQVTPLQALLWEAGWTKLGWPTSIGGLGGSPLLRATVMEELSAAGYGIPEFLGSVEIIAPMLVRFAPALAALHVPRGVAGEEIWCQGFSEPDAGSDLGSLRTRARADGDGFVLTGQKMWSSNGHIAQHCCLLARTGDPDSGYKGLTMFWVDMSSPGITVVPTRCESGRAETAELFLDEVHVPASALVGGVGEGWKVVMYLLQFERGAYAWYRQAEMHNYLGHIVDGARRPVTDAAAEQIGNAYLAVHALRAQSAGTVAALAAGRDLGPEISVDKILLGGTEQVLLDAARSLLWPRLELDDDQDAITWRRKWAYSRITTIYGGAAEVQRDLVAERLLGLPRSR